MKDFRFPIVEKGRGRISCFYHGPPDLKEITVNSAEKIRGIFRESIKTKEKTSETLAEKVSEAAGLLVEALRGGGKVILFGNGGSAADAQHIAAELVGRFKKERKGFPALALNTNTSNLTSIGNDYGFKTIFSRQLEAVARPGDVAIAISTSGGSENIITAVQQAKKMGLRCIGLGGKTGGKLAELTDVALTIPSSDTARIQECHITIGHILCEIVEEELS